MSDQITFTTAAFGGFEKKQVLDYIYKIHEEADLAQSKHKKKLEEISVAFKDLESRALTAEKDAIKLEKELRTAKSALEERSENQDDLHSETEELRQKVTQYERILAQRQQQTTVTGTIQTESDTLSRRKEEIQAEYLRMEESQTQIGRVMLDAHSKAELIVNAANADAKRMIAQAQDAIEQQRLQTNQVIKEHRVAVQAETQLTLKKAALEAGEKISHAQSYAGQLMSDMTAVAGQASTQLDLLRSKISALSSSTEDTLSGMQEFAYSKIGQQTPFPTPTKLDLPDEPSAIPPYKAPGYTPEEPTTTFSPSLSLDLTEPIPTASLPKTEGLLTDFHLEVPSFESFSNEPPTATVTPLPKPAPSTEKPEPPQPYHPSAARATMSSLNFTSSNLQQDLEKDIDRITFPSLDPPQPSTT